jgi:hypothetical protein
MRHSILLSTLTSTRFVVCPLPQTQVYQIFIGCDRAWVSFPFVPFAAKQERNGHNYGDFSGIQKKSLSA